MCCKMQPSSPTSELPPVSMAPPIDPSGLLETISGAWRAANYGCQLAHAPASRFETVGLMDYCPGQNLSQLHGNWRIVDLAAVHVLS